MHHVKNYSLKYCFEFVWRERITWHVCDSRYGFIVFLTGFWFIKFVSITNLNDVADLVFFQNGMLEPWFQSKGLGVADQVLAYFAVAKLGEPPTDGKTDTNPEGLTAAYGKWASAVASRLHAGGLSCKVCMNFRWHWWLKLPCLTLKLL